MECITRPVCIIPKNTCPAPPPLKGEPVGQSNASDAGGCRSVFTFDLWLMGQETKYLKNGTGSENTRTHRSHANSDPRLHLQRDAARRMDCGQKAGRILARHVRGPGH